MSDFIPKAGTPVRTTGLGPKAQKLQAMRDKLAQQTSGVKTSSGAANLAAKGKTLAGTKKTSFQRKAV